MYKISCVLMIEDDPIARFVSMRAIKNLNFIQEIKVCNDGKEALDHLSSKVASSEPAPELVFLDINMPKVDGYEFLTKVQRMPLINKSKIVFCILTNSSHPQDIKKFMDMGVHEYLIKPLSKETVEKLYSKYLIIPVQSIPLIPDHSIPVIPVQSIPVIF